MPSNLPDIIREKIKRDGPMPLREYMELCLGHPKHGYYMTRDPFGLDGDFTTAPEISQLFGEMIGVWLADAWIKSGSPSEFILLECGPGRGTLMADIMRATKGVSGFHAAAKIHLMEMSPHLKSLQKQALAAYDPYWISDTTQLLSKSPVFLVANEFLDALPIDQLIMTKGEWCERRVAIGPENSLVFVDVKAGEDLLKTIPERLSHALEGAVFETSLVLNQYIKSINIILKKQGGVALFVDYGHIKTALGDTLQAMKKHEYADIFDTAGTCDITAHIDFENIGKIARGDGLGVHGPVTQERFLKAMAIETRAKRLCGGANPEQVQMILLGLNRLIDTQGMGSLFKVIALCHDPEMQPEGFDENL